MFFRLWASRSEAPDAEPPLAVALAGESMRDPPDCKSNTVETKQKGGIANMVARSCVVGIEKAKYTSSTLNFLKFQTDAELIS